MIATTPQLEEGASAGDAFAGVVTDEHRFGFGEFIGDKSRKQRLNIGAGSQGSVHRELGVDGVPDPIGGRGQGRVIEGLIVDLVREAVEASRRFLVESVIGCLP